jgi:hypothetical protein
MAQNAVYQQYPSNYAGLQYQFSNIALGILGTYFPFIVSLSYSDTNDVAEGRGVSPYPMGTTLGEYKATGNIEVQKLYNEQFQALIAAQSPGGNSLYDAIFPITVQYQLRTPPGVPQAPVVTDTLNGCRLTGQGIDLSAGNGVLTVKYPLYIAIIFWNGRQPLAGLTQ